MISWTDEAIEAANNLLNKEWAAGIPDDLMRRALDAAVKAQGITEINRDYPSAAAQYRAEALEEAAALVPTFTWTGDVFGMQRKIAAAIRALKERQG